MTDVTTRALLRLYPRAWRNRYGDELASLILQASEQGSPSLRLKVDVAAQAVRERLRVLGILGDNLTPRDRTQSGVMVVMWSWMLFCLGGIGVEKAAEHWKAAVPGPNARLPEIAFAAFLAAATIGAGFVLAGVTLGCRSLVAYLQAGGWPQIRRPIYRAATVTGFTMIGLLTIAIWAHHLTASQRNGYDDAYSAAVLCWVTLFATCLFSWATAAAATARRLNFTARLLRAESRLAVAVTTTMAVMTIAIVVWWATIATAAPWFFAGTAPRTPGVVAPANVVIPAAVMFVATALGAVGAHRSLRNSQLTV